MKVQRQINRITKDRAWAASDLREIEGASIRVHWTDRPYHWHVNDGREIFIVLDGVVDMHFRVDGVENVTQLGPFDAFIAEQGDAHMAVPLSEARILVIEKSGSE